jgi:RHS repeat-associated protein
MDVGTKSYDPSGNMTADSSTGNTYLYDGEGRICAVSSTPVPGFTTMTGYVYDADGNRVAKGTITSMSCDPSVNGIATANNETDYVLGPGGEQVTELAQDANGTMNWQRTYVYAGGLIATYDPNPDNPSQPLPSFRLTDWLGTLRATTDAYGVAQGACTGLPFGDGVTCSGDIPDNHHFTGKERDQESGNDYFGARYFGSSMGRFMSPDPGPFIWRDPQTLNRYAYTRNNPLKFVDPTGMYFVIDSGNEYARQAISMMLRSPTGRALVESIAADPRPTYVRGGRLPANMYANKYSVGDHQVNEAVKDGHGVMTGTTVTVDTLNALLAGAGDNKSFFYMLLKAYGHEFSHVADANAAKDYIAALKAACMGDGNNCEFNGGDTTHGTAEALALRILAELGDPDSYTPDTASDDEAGAIIDQGNAQENGDPPWAFGNTGSQSLFGDDPQEEERQRQCGLGNPAACDTR